MRLILVVLASVALAAFAYLRLEGMGRRAWFPLLCRSIAWTALGLLLLNVSCPVPREGGGKPLVLLDGSLSLRATGGRWMEARDSASQWGELRLFGDERAGADTAARGRSLLSAALTAAGASDRPLVVVSDGEIEDASEIPPDLASRAAVRLFPRRPVGDVAIVQASAPERVALGDTVTITLELRSIGSGMPDSVRVEARGERGVLGRRSVRLAAQGTVSATLRVATSALGAGEHLVEVGLAGRPDSEARDDARLLHVVVAPTPGVLLLASPGDWDSRFLYRALKDVAQLPVRGYVRLDAERWRSMTDLSVVSGDQIRQSARGADLLIEKGAEGDWSRQSRARAVWSWPSGEDGGLVAAGDWYLSAGSSPVAGAFVGLPVDSFPPAIQVGSLQPAAGDWIGLTAQEGRRGAARPVMLGRVTGGVRRVTVAAEGLWRWAFRGGSSEEGYRAWVAATLSWLLAGGDSTVGKARPVRAVEANGRPLVFEWSGGGSPQPLSIALTGTTSTIRDTLRFDGTGRARLWPAPGRYRYRLEGGGEGLAAIEEFSDEWLPRPPTLTDHAASTPSFTDRSTARQWLWLFGACVLALAGEWWGRRRLGLR